MSRQVAFAAFWDMAISSADFFRSVSRFSSFCLISCSYARALCSASEISPAYFAMLLDVWLIRPDTLLFLGFRCHLQTIPAPFSLPAVSPLPLRSACGSLRIPAVSSGHRLRSVQKKSAAFSSLSKLWAFSKALM